MRAERCCAECRGALTRLANVRPTWYTAVLITAVKSFTAQAQKKNCERNGETRRSENLKSELEKKRKIQVSSTQWRGYISFHNLRTITLQVGISYTTFHMSNEGGVVKHLSPIKV